MGWSGKGSVRGQSSSEGWGKVEWGVGATFSREVYMITNVHLETQPLERQRFRIKIAEAGFEPLTTGLMARPFSTELSSNQFP